MELFKRKNNEITVEEANKQREAERERIERLKKIELEAKKKALDNIENFSFILPLYKVYELIDYLGTNDYEFICKEPHIYEGFCQGQPGMVEIRKRKI